MVKLSLKLGKHNIRTLSLVINKVKSFLKTQTEYINIQSQGERILENHQFLW
jgi:hypothetical protein